MQKDRDYHASAQDVCPGTPTLLEFFWWGEGNEPRRKPLGRGWLCKGGAGPTIDCGKFLENGPDQELCKKESRPDWKSGLLSPLAAWRQQRQAASGAAANS